MCDIIFVMNGQRELRIPQDALEQLDSQPTQFDFSTILRGVTNYAGIETAIKGAVDVMKEGGAKRIGFVSGPVGSSETDRDKRSGEIKSNMDRMEECTKALHEEHKFPIFSSTDIFRTVWKELDETHLPREEMSDQMKILFRNILKNCGVTDIFMMKGWKESRGAADEYVNAKYFGITIHILEEQSE